MSVPLNVLHVTTGMGRGGSESMLARLVAHSDSARVRHHVLAMSVEGPPWQDILRPSASALNLRLTEKSLALPRLRQLPGFVKACKADVIHGWMYHGNLFASWTRRLFAQSSALVYGIRQSLYDIEDERRLTRFVIRRGATASQRVHAVLYNSRVSRSQHEKIGYRSDVGVVIPNGFNTDAFRPDLQSRMSTRSRLQYTDSDFVVAIVARYHPVKDHTTFVRAAAQLAKKVPRASFLIVGPGCNPENAELQDIVSRLGGGARFLLHGDWPDTRNLYPAIDVLCLTSRGEGFPNVVGEAMSCGVPCVATAVGDIPDLIADPQWLVAPGDSMAVADRLAKLAAMGINDRAHEALQARRKIETAFAIDGVFEKYIQLYERARENLRRAH